MNEGELLILQNDKEIYDYCLKTSDAPPKKKVFCRRIKTVIQNIITLTAKLVRHARRYRLRFGKHSLSFIQKETISCYIDYTNKPATSLWGTVPLSGTILAVYDERHNNHLGY